jgi:hypothetical protein
MIVMKKANRFAFQQNRLKGKICQDGEDRERQRILNTSG